MKYLIIFFIFITVHIINGSVLENLKQLEEALGNLNGMLEVTTPEISLQKIFQEMNLMEYSQNPLIGRRTYQFIGDLKEEFMLGKRTDDDNNIKNLNAYIEILPFQKGEFQEETIQKIDAMKKEVARHYKIHLMPKPNDLEKTIVLFLQELKNNRDLQKIISRIKYLPADIPVEKPTEILPRIVIYPAKGKNNTQKALNIIYSIFKNRNIETEGKTPRFNAKVTDLIFVAQGDADQKKISHYRKYYEPRLMYYNPKEIPPVDNEPDHYLRHPETDTPLMD